MQYHLRLTNQSINHITADIIYQQLYIHLSSCNRKSLSYVFHSWTTFILWMLTHDLAIGTQDCIEIPSSVLGFRRKEHLPPSCPGQGVVLCLHPSQQHWGWHRSPPGTPLLLSYLSLLPYVVVCALPWSLNRSHSVSNTESYTYRQDSYRFGMLLRNHDVFWMIVYKHFYPM